jgi:hypothetical protein
MDLIQNGEYVTAFAIEMAALFTRPSSDDSAGHQNILALF